MGLFEQFPYTNFHEMNLDWLLQKMKELARRVDSVEELVAALKQEVETFIDNLDIQKAVNDYIDQLASDGTIKKMLDDLMSDFESDYDGRLQSLQSQVDSIIALPEGSTTGDAELINGRIGVDGVTYPTIGDAIRGQINNAANDWVNVEHATRTPGASFTYYYADFDYSFDRKVRIKNTSTSAAYVSLNWASGSPLNNYTTGTIPMTLLAAGEVREWTISASVFNINDVAYYQAPGYSMRNPNNATFEVDIYELRPSFIMALRSLRTYVISPDYLLSGVFINIQGAFDHMINHYDVNNDDCTIFMLDGLYDLVPRTDQPYRIRKGSNRISIIGESRQGTIIRLTGTPAHNNKVLDIGGPCTIAHLTIENVLNNDGSTWNTANNAYCIHNDTSFTSSAAYKTVVTDCDLYSDFYAPVGAGLQDKQTQVYDHCRMIFNPQYTGYANQGSLYVHGPASSTAAGCALEVNSCDIDSRANLPALALPNVSGSLQYTGIPVTFRRNILTSDGVPTYVSRSTHMIQRGSALNNVATLNYAT